MARPAAAAAAAAAQIRINGLRASSLPSCRESLTTLLPCKPCHYFCKHCHHRFFLSNTTIIISSFTYRFFVTQGIAHTHINILAPGSNPAWLFVRRW